MPGKSRRNREQEIEQEIRDHLERQAADFMAAGMTAEEARRQARLRFGGSGQVQEDCREVYHRRWIRALGRDLSYTLRSLRRSPGFTSAATLVLALGMGSVLAVFSLIDALFLAPLPVERPAELVTIASLDKTGRPDTILSTVLDPLRREAVFRGVCGHIAPRLAVDVDGSVVSASALAMTGDCFATLGLRTGIGRPFTMSEDSLAAERVVVLTDQYWRSHFAAGDVLGRKLPIQGVPFTVIGVAERRFTGLRTGSMTDVIIPLAQRPLDFVPTSNRPVTFWVNILARRAAGVSMRQAQARLSAIELQLLDQSAPARFDQAQRRDYLARKIVAAPVEPGAGAHVRARFEKPLYVILGICALVLSIACVNVTSLLLARGLGRRKEIAVRLALGADKGAVARLLAMQGAVLVVAGAGLAVLLAEWLRDLAITRAAELVAIAPQPVLDGRGAAFLGGIALVAAAAFAIAPVWQAMQVMPALGQNGRGIAGSGTRGQKVLLACQVSLTMALVAGAGILTSSMKHLNEMNLGMRTSGVSAAMLAPLAGNSGGAGPYYRELLQQAAALPEVASAALADFAPFWSGSHTEPVMLVENPGRSDIRARTAAVSEDFFATLEVRIVAGRGFRTGDTEPSAVISQSLAKLSGGEAAIGRHIVTGDTRSVVVGIAANAQLSLENPDDTSPLTVYLNLWAHPERQRYGVLLVKGRTTGAVLRRLVQSRGREYVEHFMTVDEAKDQALIENRLLAWLSAAFGGLALLLAATGLFGLLSYHVAGRTAEIGIRMALGAERPEIEGLVLRQLLSLMGAGIAGGLVLTVALGRVMTGLVFGVGAADPRLLGVSVGALLLTAVTAAWIPARRAASVDPVVALRL